MFQKFQITIRWSTFRRKSKSNQILSLVWLSGTISDNNCMSIFHCLQCPHECLWVFLIPTIFAWLQLRRKHGKLHGHIWTLWNRHKNFNNRIFPWILFLCEEKWSGAQNLGSAGPPASTVHRKNVGKTLLGITIIFASILFSESCQ